MMKSLRLCLLLYAIPPPRQEKNTDLTTLGNPGRGPVAHVRLLGAGMAECRRADFGSLRGAQSPRAGASPATRICFVQLKPA